MENNFSQKKKKNLKGNQDAGQNPGLPIKRKTSVYLYGEVKKKKKEKPALKKNCVINTEYQESQKNQVPRTKRKTH